MDNKMVWILPDVEEKEINWELPTWGKGVMYHSPFDIDGWTIAPATPADLHSIPKIAIERVEQMINSGVKIQGLVIAHDIFDPPKTIEVDSPDIIDIEWSEEPITKPEKFEIVWPTMPEVDWQRVQSKIDQVPWRKIGDVTLKVGKVIVTGAVVIAGAIAAICLVGILCALSGGTALAAAPTVVESSTGLFDGMSCGLFCGDPVLIAVIDDTWVEVHRWFE